MVEANRLGIGLGDVVIEVLGEALPVVPHRGRGVDERDVRLLHLLLGLGNLEDLVLGLKLFCCEIWLGLHRE